MSKVEKMRGRLASMQKDREEFERQKKELEEQMNIGRKNMDKIQKGLKNNVILNDPELLDAPNSAELNNTPKRMSKRDMKSFIAQGANQAGMLANMGSSVSNGLNLSDGNNSALTAQIIIPGGPRISEWCFTGPLDSAPPIVKSKEMYENVRLLGRGAFGEVNLVKNIEDNKLFAIKTIFCNKDHELDGVCREIRFLRLSRHPCIIDVHDAFITTNPRVVHIVMHYCESGSLASVISSAKKTKTFISESQIAKWLVQLALALNFLHEKHILHRDMKPMNVMLTEGGDLLKVADFGLAMNMDDKGADSNMDEAGTPYYTAPEMIQREAYSYPTDCWSLGIIMHQLLALERPFEGSNTADLVKAILTAEPPALPAHYSEDIKDLSRKLLLKNPTQRMSMSQMLTSPYLFPKAVSFPQIYRPRNLEERIRRSHLRLLETQIEIVQRARRASSLVKQKSERSLGEGLSSPQLSPVHPSALIPHTAPHHPSTHHNNTHHNNAEEGGGGAAAAAGAADGGMVITGHHVDGRRLSGMGAAMGVPHLPALEEGTSERHHASPHHYSAKKQHIGKSPKHAPHPHEEAVKPHVEPVAASSAEIGDILQMSDQLLQGAQQVEEISPKGGRKGEEIAKAIEQDHLLEEILATAPSTATNEPV